MIRGTLVPLALVLVPVTPALAAASSDDASVRHVLIHPATVRLPASPGGNW